MLGLLATSATGCGKASSSVSSAARAAEKTAIGASRKAGPALVLVGYSRGGGTSPAPAWSNPPAVLATTTTTTPAKVAPGATRTATTIATSTTPFGPLTLLGDGTINDGTDPFLAMMRTPAVRPTFDLAGAKIPAAVAPAGDILDFWAVMRAPTGVVKVATINCGGMSTGSGWMASADTVVTNAHVVAGAERRPRVQVNAKGIRYPAALVYLDVPNDIAILRVPGITGATVLPFAPAPTVGDKAAIIGYPNGGDVHLDAAQLGVTQTDTVRQYDGWRRPIASRRNTYVSGFSEPGASGGAVVNEKGQVLATVWGNVYDAQPAMTVAVDNATVIADLTAAGSSEVSPGPCIAK